jgi:hypothetical protein
MYEKNNNKSSMYNISRLPTAPEKKSFFQYALFPHRKWDEQALTYEQRRDSTIGKLCTQDRDGDIHIRFMLFSRLYNSILKNKSVVCEIPVR